VDRGYYQDREAAMQTLTYLPLLAWMAVATVC